MDQMTITRMTEKIIKETCDGAISAGCLKPKFVEIEIRVSENGYIHSCNEPRAIVKFRVDIP